MFDDRSVQKRMEEMTETLSQPCRNDENREFVTGQSLLDRIPDSEWRKHAHRPLVAVSVHQLAIIDSGDDEDQLIASNSTRFPDDVIVIALSKFYGGSVNAA